MSAPQGGYPPQEAYGQPSGYGSSPGSPSSQQPGLAHGNYSSYTHHGHGGRRKRAYAGEAFEFGSGANAGLGGQPPLAGGAYGQFPPQPQPPTVGYEQPVYGADPIAAQSAVPGYAAPGYAPPVAPGISQMTQQFGAMGVSDPYQTAQAPTRMPVPVALNQLYPTDIIAQPFNVAELDYPPPPIVLPPNVSVFCATPGKRSWALGLRRSAHCATRPAFIPRPMRIALPNTYDRPSMLFQQRTLS